MDERIHLIQMINRADNFERAEGMLEMFNAIYGTQYGFLAKRVVRFDNPNASVAEKYASCHDVLTELKFSE